ncbi:MAG: rhodanese-like domain-containing protein [FCB group bacterium]|nr:rhodanese-like domain-containing protein [FCB group bacterium]
MTALKQIAIIVVLGTLLGLVRFAFTADDFKLLKEKRVLKTVAADRVDGTEVERYRIPDFMTEPLAIDLPFAKSLFDDKLGLFIDARDPDEFSAGHIPGALNIPYDYYEDFEDVITALPRDKTLITYCSGGECDLSTDLGDYLFNERGFTSVLVFSGGMTFWEEAGYITE